MNVVCNVISPNSQLSVKTNENPTKEKNYKTQKNRTNKKMTQLGNCDQVKEGKSTLVGPLMVVACIFLAIVKLTALVS